MNIQITFPYWDQTFTFPPCTTVAQACSAAGHPLPTVCGGNGTCGKCRVHVRINGREEAVLACQTPIREGMEILLTPKSESISPILTATPENASSPANSAFILLGDYGAACDLGTTSVVVSIHNLKTGQLLAQKAAMNRQRAEGADVIARLQAVLEKGRGTLLQQEAVSTINGLLTEGCRECGISPTEIAVLVIAGNTVMEHLLLALPVKQLAVYPYQAYQTSRIQCPACELGISIAPDGIVETFPMIGSFVGGDTVAAMLATGFGQLTSKRLLVDLGTNGEIVLCCNGQFWAASAAAGPALEGGGISCGMHAADGAAEAVFWQDGKLLPKTIGSGETRGICGSGLVSLIAQLLRKKILSPDGKLLSRAEFSIQEGVSPCLDQLETIDGENAFCLTGQVALLQSDVRAFQLSKGAIAAAISLLADSAAIPLEDLDEILLAGAFGNYIDLQDAQYTGLLPTLSHVPVIPVGNAASAGARRYLLSAQAREEAQALAAKTTHVELSTHSSFFDVFAQAMDLASFSSFE